jgi:hypothetical protein
MSVGPGGGEGGLTKMTVAVPPRPTAALAEAGDGRIGRQPLGFSGWGRVIKTAGIKSTERRR